MVTNIVEQNGAGWQIHSNRFVIENEAYQNILLIILKIRYLKATIIVAIFKLMLSPHSPPTAYIAVLFQGLMGQVFLNRKQFFTAASIFVAVISLVESAMQRLFVLWLVYGESFWDAVNQFIQKITGSKTINNYSLLIAVGYVLIHAIVGSIIGYWISNTIKNTEKWKLENKRYIFDDKSISATNQEPVKIKKKKRIRLIFALLSIILLAFYILSIVKPAWAPLPAGKAASIFLRSVVILMCWYFIAGPLVMKFIKKQLAAKQKENKEDIDNTLQLLPQMRYTFQQAWFMSAEKKGLKRLRLFIQIVIANTIRT